MPHASIAEDHRAEILLAECSADTQQRPLQITVLLAQHKVLCPPQQLWQHTANTYKICKTKRFALLQSQG